MKIKFVVCQFLGIEFKMKPVRDFDTYKEAESFIKSINTSGIYQINKMYIKTENIK